MSRVYAVVAAHGRKQMTDNLVKGLLAENIYTIVVSSNNLPAYDLSGVIPNGSRCISAPGVVVLTHTSSPVNLSAVWNCGLDYVSQADNGTYSVAVLNNDLEVPAGTLQKLASSLDEYDVDITFPDQFGRGKSVIDKSPPCTPRDLTARMCGYAFMIRGSAKIRINESMLWWCSDGDAEMQARSGRGTALVGGVTVNHLEANGYTNAKPELMEQANKDVQTFKAIWGFPPVEGW